MHTLQSIWGHSVSTNVSQVSVSNIAQQIPQITSVSIMKVCEILGCNSECFWRYSHSNALFYISGPLQKRKTDFQSYFTYLPIDMATTN